MAVSDEGLARALQASLDPKQQVVSPEEKAYIDVALAASRASAAAASAVDRFTPSDFEAEGKCDCEAGQPCPGCSCVAVSAAGFGVSRSGLTPVSSVPPVAFPLDLSALYAELDALRKRVTCQEVQLADAEVTIRMLKEKLAISDAKVAKQFAETLL